MSQSTAELIRDLATDLPPVRPLARVRNVIALALAVSAPFYLYWILVSGFRQQFQQGDAPTATYLLVAVTIVALALGGMLCGLASAIPGREELARRGRSLFILGFAGGLALLLFGQLSGSTPLAESATSSLGCVKWAATLAIPSALIFVRYVYRGAARTRPVAVALVAAGGIAVAASIVHLTCANPEPLHMVLGHAMAPLYGGLLLLAAAYAAAAFGFTARGATPR